MTPHEPDDSLHKRGTLGLIVLAVPIVSIVVVGAAYVALTTLGHQGRAASGPLTQLHFLGCEEAIPVVRARAEAMGLPELTVEPGAPGSFTVTARLPAEPRTHLAIPGTLAAPGTFALRNIRGGPDGADEDEPLFTHADIEYATTYLAFLDAPKVHVQLKKEAAIRLRDWMRAHPEDGMGMWIDGERVTVRKNMPPEHYGEVTLDRVGATDMERMDFAAGAAIELQHGPLPCEVQLLRTQAVDGR
jgi:hypothetical protein